MAKLLPDQKPALRAWIGWPTAAAPRFFNQVHADLPFYFHRPPGPEAPVEPYDQNEQIAGYGDLFISTWLADDRLVLANGDGYGLSFYRVGNNFYFLSPPAPPIPSPTPLRAPIISVSQFTGTPGDAAALVPNDANRTLFHLYDAFYFADPAQQNSFPNVYQQNLKPTGMLALGGKLYLAYTQREHYWDPLTAGIAAGILVSDGPNPGSTWQPATGMRIDTAAATLWRGPKFSAPVFVQFGQNYGDYAAYDPGVAIGTDTFVHALATGVQWWNSDNLYLGRVPAAQILNAAAWEYFTGIDAHGAPLWSANLEAGISILHAAAEIGQPSALYCAQLDKLTQGAQRFLMTTWSNGGRFDYDTRQDKRFFLWSAPHPWGPWTKIATNDYNGLQNNQLVEAQQRYGFGGYHAQLMPKWISATGNQISLWVLLSGFYNINGGNPGMPNADKTAVIGYTMFFAPLTLELGGAAPLAASRSAINCFNTRAMQHPPVGATPEPMLAGFEFTVARAIQVSHLGRIYNSANAGLHTLSLSTLNADDTATLLAQVAIDFSNRNQIDAHGFYYGPLAPAVALQPGQRYLLASTENDGPSQFDTWFGFDQSTDATGRAVTDRAMAYAYNNAFSSAAAQQFTGWVGMQLAVTRPLRVTALGRWKLPGNAQSHQLQLLQLISGTLTPVISATVDLTAFAGNQLFLYAFLPAAITLEPGIYYLISQESASGDAFLGNPLDPAAMPSLAENLDPTLPFPIAFGGALRTPGDPVDVDAWQTYPATAAWSIGPVNLRFIDDTFARVQTGNTLRIQNAARRLPAETQWMLAPPSPGTPAGDGYGPLNLRYTPLAENFADADLNAAPFRNWNGFIGLRFTTGPNPVRVLTLLRFGNHLQNAHELRLMTYRDGGEASLTFVSLDVIAFAVADAASPREGKYARANLATPVLLAPNTRYILASREFDPGDKFYGNSFLAMPRYMPNPAFTIDGPVYSLGDLWKHDAGDLPGTGYGPLNLLFD